MVVSNLQPPCGGFPPFGGTWEKALGGFLALVAYPAYCFDLLFIWDIGVTLRR